MDNQIRFFTPGVLASIVDAGEGVDTIVGAGEDGANVRLAEVGRIGDEIAIAMRQNAVGTSLVFGAEALEGAGSVSFATLGKAITYNADTGTTEYSGGGLALVAGTSVAGSRLDDTITGSGIVTASGGAGADTITGGDNSFINGGRDADILTAGANSRLSGGAGDDIITSGGNSTLSAGTGADVLHAKRGDLITDGDALDQLFLEGVHITGEGVMFSERGLFRNTVSGEIEPTVLDQEFIVFVSPGSVALDGEETQANLTWTGSIVLNPTANDFDAQGFFRTENADATIIFEIGDFGIQSAGLATARRLDVLVQWNLETAISPYLLPVGDVDDGVDAPEPDTPDTLLDLIGVDEAELEPFFAFRDAVPGGGPVNDNGGGGGGGDNQPALLASDDSLVFDGSPLDLLANDNTPDGATLSVDDTGTRGRVSVDQTGAVAYDPAGAFAWLAPGESAVDSFSYRLSDGVSDSDPARVEVTVQGPTALTNAGDAFSFSQGTNGGNNRFGFDGDHFTVGGQGVSGTARFDSLGAFIEFSVGVFDGSVLTSAGLDDEAAAVGALGTVATDGPKVTVSGLGVDGSFEAQFDNGDDAASFGAFVTSILDRVAQTGAVATDPTGFRFDAGGLRLFFDDVENAFGLTADGGVTEQRFGSLETFVEAVATGLGGTQTRDGSFNAGRIAEGRAPNPRLNDSDDLILSGQSVGGRFTFAFDNRSEAETAREAIATLFDAIDEADAIAFENLIA